MTNFVGDKFKFLDTMYYIYPSFQPNMILQNAYPLAKGIFEEVKEMSTVVEDIRRSVGSNFFIYSEMWDGVGNNILLPKYEEQLYGKRDNAYPFNPPKHHPFDRILQYYMQFHRFYPEDEGLYTKKFSSVDAAIAYYSYFRAFDKEILRYKREIVALVYGSAKTSTKAGGSLEITGHKKPLGPLLDSHNRSPLFLKGHAPRSAKVSPEEMPESPEHLI